MDLNSGSTTVGDPFLRQSKERRVVATQACETCRLRKQKCDEQRPKCSLCQRLGVQCVYRVPEPTKKDKTLVEILDRLKSIEGKLDQIEVADQMPPGFYNAHPPPSNHRTHGSTYDDLLSFSAPPLNRLQTQSTRVAAKPYRHTSAAHRIPTWPRVEQLLIQASSSSSVDLNSLEQEGSAFILRMLEGTPELPREGALQERPFVGMLSQARQASGAPRVTYPALTSDVMNDLATAYFDTLNLIYPFMDRQSFFNETLPKVRSEGFDDDRDSIIALLVFALGKLAIEGCYGRPIEVYKGRSSGVRGGTSSKPPGLTFFNAAMKHIGFILTNCDLENVQIFSLAALYYGSCSHHVEFWRLNEFAALACRDLITRHSIDWASPRGDIVKRAYWHCAIIETGLYLELDLPRTGLIDLEDQVGIPTFNSLFSEADFHGNQFSQFEAHYASQIALRRLCVYIHDNINQVFENIETPLTGFSGPTASSLKLLASQISQWRSLLPPELQWNEDEPAAFPALQPVHEQDQRQDQNLSMHPRHSRQTLFTEDIISEPVHYPYAYDIQVALLRTRYYYAKYMVFRPFVYKALHFPEEMTDEDADGVAECLRSCLTWPILLSPTSRRKRLIPYLFCWSQNFLGILLIIHMTQHDPILHDIRARLCGQRFEAGVHQTVVLMIDWIRDLKSVDTMAMWCWKILQVVYHIDPQ